MRLLDKYICREVGSHAFLGFAVFTFVLFIPRLIQLMDLIVRHSGGAGTVALVFLCLLPPALIFTIPMAVLVGVLPRPAPCCSIPTLILGEGTFFQLFAIYPEGPLAPQN